MVLFIDKPTKGKGLKECWRAEDNYRQVARSKLDVPQSLSMARERKRRTLVSSVVQLQYSRQNKL